MVRGSPLIHYKTPKHPTGMFNPLSLSLSLSLSLCRGRRPAQTPTNVATAQKKMHTPKTARRLQTFGYRRRKKNPFGPRKHMCLDRRRLSMCDRKLCAKCDLNGKILGRKKKSTFDADTFFFSLRALLPLAHIHKRGLGLVCEEKKKDDVFVESREHRFEIMQCAVRKNFPSGHSE
jgi:hypothetical protein